MGSKVAAKKNREELFDELTNYSSALCGALVVSASEGAVSVESILNEDGDRYLRVPCTKGWSLVIRLCDHVNIKTITLENHEYFSAAFKNFDLYTSDSYSSEKEEWDHAGSYTAKNVRQKQEFVINRPRLVRYIMIKMRSNYGHYKQCTLNSIGVFGTTMIDEARNYTREHYKSRKEADKLQEASQVITDDKFPINKLQNNEDSITVKYHDTYIGMDTICDIVHEYYEVMNQGGETTALSDGVHVLKYVPSRVFESCISGQISPLKGGPKDEGFMDFVNSLWKDHKNQDANFDKAKYNPTKLSKADSNSEESDESDVFASIIRRITHLERKAEELKAVLSEQRHKIAITFMNFKELSDKEIGDLMDAVKATVNVQNKIMMSMASNISELSLAVGIGHMKHEELINRNHSMAVMSLALSGMFILTIAVMYLSKFFRYSYIYNIHNYKIWKKVKQNNSAKKSS